MVEASVETEAVNAKGDAADDPALWIHPVNPERSLILGTQKKQGLYSYDLDGNIKQFLPAGRLNNVDIRQNVSIQGQPMDVVAATNRSNNSISVFRVDSAGEITPWAELRVDVSAFPEVYGFCMGQVGTELIFVLTGKDADAEIYRLDINNQAIRKVRTLTIPSQSEGCVVNDVTGDVYIGEEAAGVWRFNYLQPVKRELIIRVDGEKLVADVEGLALIRHQGRDFLMVSSQGNSEFPIYDLNNNQHITSVKVVKNDRFDRVSGTDGIDVNQGLKTTAYPAGVFLTQDDKNTNPKANQNFKVVSLKPILERLK